MNEKNYLLKNKVALITGTNRGIGKSIVEVYAGNGAIVYANSRDEGSIDDYCLDLSNRYSTTVIPTYFDVTNNDAIRECFTLINKQHKRLDVLVNNAGIMKDAVIGMITDKLIYEVFNVNVNSVFMMIQYATKLMLRNKSGSIINISSIIGINGNLGQTVYSASKGAVNSLTKSASKELAASGIRVNAIAPGIIDTELFRSLGEGKVEEYSQKIKMGRLGTGFDVANAALYLASDLSEYVTGQILCVDGCAQL